mgnify:CR=1 FL=1
MRYFKFDRLVRDEIVYQILKNGDLPNYRYLDDDEYVRRLKEKLLEESQEVCVAEKKEDLLEELADVLEVVESMLEVMGSSKLDLRKVQAKKRKINGSFKKRIVVEYVRCEEKSKWLNYYLENKQKYPEISVK